MILKWTDSLEIALALIEQYPEQDPLAIRFTDLRDWVLALEGFDDKPEHCSERILEAIQLSWIDEND
ncbi:Fe-S cluster assembly protein IscX [Psychromonas arctica]|uniref:Fe-S cluster assembly protein IscX n=1 Tax=Psychromonas arctica TaxID=168275 RepID=A0ABU9HB84_9GAMM